MNDTTPNPFPDDKTVPAHSVPPVSSGMYGHGSHLLQSGLMLPPQAPGTLGVIGKYQVIKILGEGGMGQVVLAREPVTDSMVAIKLIKPEFLNKSWAVHRFLTEARHMFRMSHGSIIRVLDVSDRPEGPYFVMPFMSGGSLADKIKPGEPLPPETILPVARAVAEALHHAHTRGITHRDLKPSNILLDAEGKAQLADFGLLRTFLNDTIIDASQPQMEGTVPYMSPAVAAGKAEDTRCDIYAFGCLLYEMLTGQPPYQGPTVDAVLKQIQDGPPPPIRQLNPQAPAHLTAIADHAMARELRDRYASMADVVAELERVVQGKAPVGTHGTVAAKPKKKKAMIAAGAVVLVGLAAFGISRLDWKHEDKPPIVQPAPTPLQNGISSPETFVGGDYTYTVKNDAVTIVKYTGPGGDITIPHEIKGLPVAAIGDNAFRECAALTGVTIPDSVTAFGSRAFQDCKGLTTVVIPGSVVDTGDRTFMGCIGLTNVTMKNGVTMIGFASFAGCSGLTHITLPNTVTRFVAAAFRGSGLHGITIPASVTTLDGAALSDCPNLTEITIPASVTSISGSFVRSIGLISINVDPSNPAYSSSPDGVLLNKDGTCLVSYPGGRPGNYDIPVGIRTVGVHAFNGCTYLTSVTLPESVTSIEQEAFRGCDNLTAVSFRGNAPKLGKDVFEAISKSAIFYYLPTTKGWGKDFGGRPTAVWEPEKDAKPSLPQTSAATPAPLTEGPFSYTVKDGAVTIVKYTGPGGDVNIPEKINGLPVTIIGDGAFAGCVKLTGVTIPSSVTTINFNAFTSCEGLTIVKIPPSVTKLAANPFSSCSGLMSISVDGANPAYSSSADGVVFNTDKTILVSYPGGKAGGYTIPDGVTDISQSAFRYCVRLTDVTIPASVKTIGLYAFRNCQNLTSIHFKGDPPAISGPTFEYSDSVTVYYLPEAKGWSKLFGGRPTAVWDPEKDAKPSVPQASGASVPLVEGPFSYTVKDGKVIITKYTGPGGQLTIPDKINGMPVTGIGNSAFAGCTGLTSVVIPNSVTDIGVLAFCRCVGLTRVNIPASVTTVGDAMFAYCNELAAVTVDPANPAFSSSADGVMFNKDKTGLILCPNGKAGSYEVPASVTQIRPNAFEGCLKLTTVVIPKGVKRIEGYTFKGCANLTSVTIPDSVTSIGRVAFQFCTNLARITIPNSVTSIEGDAFHGCTKMAGVTIPASVTTMGVTPFFACTEMTAITVDEANPAFASADGVLFDKQKTVLLHCPAGKSGIYTVPAGVTRIDRWAFGNCMKLTGIAMPASVTEIGDRVFSGCTGLETLTIPAGVTSIEPDALLACSKLTAILVDPANPAFCSTADGVLFNKDKTKLLRCTVSKAGSYLIPNGVTSIERQAFNGCGLLTDVTIPDSVTAICDSYAFSGCSRLSRVTFGKGIRSIGKLAFNSCGSLSTVLFNGNAPDGGADLTIFSRSANALVCHLAGATGWGKEFGGRPTAMWDPKIPFVFTAENRVAAITKYTGAGGDVLIPDKINGMPVTRIGENAFNGCANVSSIKIPGSVTAIGAGAFTGCTGLAGITIPAGVTGIDPDAFPGCGKLAAIMVDAANPAYSSSADGVMFNKEKTRLVRCPPGMAGSYGIPDGVTSIERRAFSGCGGLTDVTIPDSVTMICDDHVFSACPRLSQVMIGKGVTSIGQHTFDSCTGLTGVVFKGNAPGDAADSSIFNRAPKATVFYQPGMTGWGKEFGGRPTAVWDPKPPYTFTIARGAVTITKYTGPGGDARSFFL